MRILIPTFTPAWGRSMSKQTTEVTYAVDEARRIIGDAGLIGRASASGTVLVIYDGDEENPGTWMEIDRLRITAGRISSSSLQSVVS